MTEGEWLACTDPKPMLRFLNKKVSERKARLYGIACCRSIDDRCLDWTTRRALAVAEWLAEDKASTEEVRKARTGLESGGVSPGFHELAFLTCCQELGWRLEHLLGALIEGQAKLALDQAHQDLWTHEWRLDWTRACVQIASEAGPSHVELIREVFGNPFRQESLNPAWRTQSVLALAQTAYDERSLPAGTLDPDRLTILSDALEDAGCTDAEILGHLRGPGPHVRGCWPVDLLLGKG